MSGDNGSIGSVDDTADADPFVAIATAPPALTVEDATAIARDHYGLTASASPLVSERDQNFLLDLGGGERSILKVANTEEDPAVTTFQIEALLHIDRQQVADLSVPAILPTRDGASHLTIEQDGASHIVRLVSYLPGELLGDRTPSPETARDLGRCLARLDRALSGFRHPGEQPGLLWDMKRAGHLRQLLPHIADDECRDLIESTITEFETDALPLFEQLPWQVIHNDANPANILVDGNAIAGLIDFGDMLYSPRIIELGVAGAYLRVLNGNPLALIVELLHGYHSVSRLRREEANVLHTLIKTRLATTVAILYWRASLRAADDAYLAAAIESEKSALDFLERLAAIPSTNAAQIYSQVCASAQLEL